MPYEVSADDIDLLADLLELPASEEYDVVDLAPPDAGGYVSADEAVAIVLDMMEE